MPHRSATKILIVLAAMLPIAVLPFNSASAQTGSQGTVAVTVADQSGSVVPDAKLELQDLATNDIRGAVSQGNGTYTFVNLSVGTYKLSVSKQNFETEVFDSVVVHAARVTDVSVKLRVGGVTEKVEISVSATPLVDTTSNAIGTTIDLKQIESLPLGGRDLGQLANYVPGFTGNVYGATWNGLPGAAQGNNIDGVIGSSSRFKDGGNAAPGPSVRIEDIQEMTIQTDQLDLNQGFGQANMQINFVTRRGTNEYHGRVFEDHQNAGLNANSWLNNAFQQPRGKFILNDFGASVGGPILKNKLFFFASYAENKQPGSFNPTNQVLTPSAQLGNYTYVDTNGNTQTVNVLQVAANSGMNLPSTVNPVIATELAAINKSLQYGKVAATSDPNLQTLLWSQNSPTTNYFPAGRLDYNISQNFRLNWAFNQTKNSAPTALPAQFPGPDFNYQVDGFKNNSYTTALGFDWTIRPTLINQFRGGYLYFYQAGAYKAGNTYQKMPLVFWNLPNTPAFMSGQFFYTTQTNFYPLLNASDSMTWQHGKHTLSFGVSWYREQDHYWNPPLGYNNIALGLATGDPALNAFTTGPTGTLPNANGFQQSEAEALYAVLVGRISSMGGNHPVDPKTKQFVPFGAVNLDELQQAYGLFFQDSFRFTPNLTLNYGLRWDFTGDDHDLNGLYTSVTSAADLWGPTGFANQFNPGSLKGSANPQYVAQSHQYHPWNVSPQPAFGLAWNPQFHQGLLGALTGGQTTIRVGYALRRFTEAYQNFWSYASNYGAFFYQGFFLNPNTTGQPGTFAPGSLALGDTFPAFALSPPTYTSTFPESGATFVGPGLAGMNPHIAQPYIQSWNLGVQRQLSRSNAIEVRYVGNRGVHEWLGMNINEANIFENGFLKQFQSAQANLRLNNLNAGQYPQFAGTFAYNSAVAGEQPLPIFTAAFAGEPSSPQSNDFSNGQFLAWLQQGQAGALASTLSGINGTVPYFCNLVGSAFSPCATNAGFTGAGAGYPINFFQANPFQAGGGVGYLDAAGYSNYHGLQVEFRQNNSHGLQLNVNYTLSHSLGLNSPGNGDSTFPMETLRDLRLNYGPPRTDIRHVAHIIGTYDFPFGQGRYFVNRKGLLDRVVGGWTVGTIVTLQSGLPFRLYGGYSTFNNLADGGIALNGISVSQLRNAIGVYHTGGPFVDFINPKYIGANGQANSAYLSPNITPGTIGLNPYLYGPHFVNTDLSLTKRFRIHENIAFSFQGEFLNAFNHPNWAPNWTPANTFGNNNLQSGAFGTTTTLQNGPRAIELRANIEF